MGLQTPDPEADRNVTASLTLGQGKSAPPHPRPTPCTGPCLMVLDMVGMHQCLFSQSPASAGRVCGSCLGHELRREDSLAHWPEPTPSPAPGQVLLLGSPGTPLSAFRLEPCNIVQNAQEQWIVISSVQKNSVPNRNCPEGMLNINMSSSRKRKRLVKMKLNFATENFYSFCCNFLKDASEPSQRSVFRQLIHFTAKTQIH